MSVAPTSLRDQFNPELFVFDHTQSYPWLVFPQVTVATITFNRLEYSRRMFESLERYGQMPYQLLVVDNASEDGTGEFLAELATQRPNLRVVQNRRNVGKGRALLQIRDMLHDGLLVFLDNDVELLSNYWLIHLQKAYHAARLALGTADVGFGPRLLNCEEYGFRFAHHHEVMPIPTERNAEPRTSYAARSKDGTVSSQILDEEVVIGWTDFLHGPIMCMPVAVFQQVRLETMYPVAIGSEDGFVSDELRRLGVRFGYIMNGPVARHNDWPYTEEKIALYNRLTRERAVTDLPYIRWKLQHAWRQLKRR
jgi:GT2 family glycosyltransferase